MKLRKFIATTINEYLNEQKNVLNDNFWKWFGSSRLVANRKPMICYHGTSEKNIQEFDVSRIGYNKGNLGHYGYGIYFSDDIREAKTYGNVIYECYIKMTNPFTGTDKEIALLKKNGIDNIDDEIVVSIDFKSFKNQFKKDKFVFNFINDVERVGLSKAWDNVINSNPKEDLDKLNDISDMIQYTTLNKNVDGVPDDVLDDLKTLNLKPELNMGFPYHQSLHWITELGNRSKEVTDVIKKLGYDGVWYGSEIVAFDPGQIKSIENDGSWDTTDNNIFS